MDGGVLVKPWNCAVQWIASCALIDQVQLNIIAYILLILDKMIYYKTVSNL